MSSKLVGEEVGKLFVKLAVISKGAPVLEELNKTPEKYVNYNALLNTTKYPPELIVTLEELRLHGCVDQRFVEKPKEGEDTTEYKILEKGQKGLVNYKKILGIMEQLP